MDLLTASRWYHYGGTLLPLRLLVLFLVVLLLLAVRWKAGARWQPWLRGAQSVTAGLGLLLAGWLVAVEILVFRFRCPLCLAASLALAAAFGLGFLAPGWKSLAVLPVLAAAGLGYLLPFGTIPRIATISGPVPPLDPASAARQRGQGPLLIQEFGDFQCPACGQADRTLERFVDTYPSQVRSVFRHLPLTSIHPWAEQAAITSECAARQGRFDPVRRDLFARQAQLATILEKGFEESWNLPDEAAFRTCVKERQTEETVEKDAAEARRLGLRSTPSLLIGNTLVVGSTPFSRLGTILQLARERSSPSPGTMIETPGTGCESGLSAGGCSAEEAGGVR